MKTTTRIAALVAAMIAAPAGLAAQEPASCPAGRISSIEIRNGSIFDSSTTTNGFLRFGYDVGNRLHMRTRERFIRDELLFEEGDCFDPALALDSQLELEQHPFLRRVSVRDEDDGAGGRRMIVETWDEWSLRVDLGVNYDEGVNLERIRVAERNFLGRGILADGNYARERERKDWTLRFSTPRLFGRAGGSIAAGRFRRGDFVEQSVSYPFVGITGRLSMREAFSVQTRDFVYAAGEPEPFSHVLLPVERLSFELAAARRYGPAERSWILGASLDVETTSFPTGVAFVNGGNFDEPVDAGAPLPELARQLRPRGIARVAVHVGRRGYTPREYVGLDAIRDVQTVGLGSFVGITLGRGIGALAPGGVPAADDPHVRFHASFGKALGASLLHGGTTLEGRLTDGVKDLLGEADVAFFGRADWLPSQTIFARVSLAGGWDTEIPFQLTLGGRDGVRALHEFEYPGGRQFFVTLEDRVVLPWPDWTAADFGFTVFGDVGRIWAGDVPYGVNSGWKGGMGVGLRVGAPSGTRNAYRPDIVFPIGPGSHGPIFRLTIEVNRIRSGFFTSELSRSRQFNRGPEHF